MSNKSWQSSSIVIACLTILSLTPLGCTGSQTAAQSPQIAQGSMMQSSKGTFVSVEHTTTGQIALKTEGAQRYVVFNNAFQTSSGPDLFVILHRSDKPQRYDSKDYVLLGQLQNVKGEQRYALPANIDLKDFKSVVIWCRQFSATFGYAPLPSA